jgi:hypothetical protein
MRPRQLGEIEDLCINVVELWALPRPRAAECTHRETQAPTANGVERR